MIVMKKWIIENYNKHKAIIFDNKLPEVVLIADLLNFSMYK